jgi:uncharacterized coiled-coil protein SlyX
MTTDWSGHAPDLVRDNKLMHERIALQDREIERLNEILTCPRLTAEAPTEQYKAVLADFEKGLPVNGQDAINALHWRVRNQTREIARQLEQQALLRGELAEAKTHHDILHPTCDAELRAAGVAPEPPVQWVDPKRTEPQCIHGNVPLLCTKCPEPASREATKKLCEHYWGDHTRRCQLPDGHEGEHLFLVPGYAIDIDAYGHPPAVKSREQQ